MPMSIGMGLAFVPVTLLGTSGVATDDTGLASGLFNTAQQVGGALGLAILSTLAASRTTSLGKGADALHPLAARVGGYHVAFLGAAIMLAIAVGLLAFALRRRHMRDVERELAATGGVPVPAAA
jgi:hypothetical protein